MSCHWASWREAVKFNVPGELDLIKKMHSDPYSSALLCRSALHAYYVRSIQMFLYIARKQAWVIPLFLLSSLLISLCYWHVSSLFHHTWIPYHAITVTQRKRCSASQSKHAEHRKWIKLWLYLVIRLTWYGLMTFYRHMCFRVVPPGVLWSECCCRKSRK